MPLQGCMCALFVMRGSYLTAHSRPHESKKPEIPVLIHTSRLNQMPCEHLWQTTKKKKRSHSSIISHSIAHLLSVSVFVSVQNTFCLFCLQVFSSVPNLYNVFCYSEYRARVGWVGGAPHVEILEEARWVCAFIEWLHHHKNENHPLLW